MPADGHAFHMIDPVDGRASGGTNLTPQFVERDVIPQGKGCSAFNSRRDKPAGLFGKTVQKKV